MNLNTRKMVIAIILCATFLLPTAVFAAGDSLDGARDILQKASASSFAVLHTGDINGQMAQTDAAVGFPMLSSLLDDTRSAYDTMLVDSGNALEGDGGKSIKVMNAAGYTAAAIGTKDAALGIERLQELSELAQFPLLCANWLKDDGDLLFEPYAIVEIGNSRVGVIGLISPEIAETYPEITKNCNVYKPSGIANIYQEEMVAAGCDYFVALTSLGYDGEYTPRDLGKESPWLSLILDSNTGTELEMGELIENTNVIAFNLPADFAAVGSLVVTTGVQNGNNQTVPSVITNADLTTLTADAAVQTAIDEAYDEQAVLQAASDAASEGTVTTSGGGGMSRTAYFITFGVIIVVTVGIVLFMSMKGSDKKKKKK